MAQTLVRALIGATVLSVMASWSQSLTWLGTLRGYDYSVAYGVSADGSVVVGWAYNAAGWPPRAFRWTAAGGIRDLGTLPGGYSNAAYGISPDGSFVVGWSTLSPSGWPIHAVRWAASGGIEDLGMFRHNSDSFAYNVSADGSVVVGEVYVGQGQYYAFRWTHALGMRDLYTLPGYGSSAAYGVSADGLVVVGEARNAAGQYRAFRWTLDTRTGAGVMEDLNTTYASLLTDGSSLWVAFAISPDGRYIVGYGYNAATNRFEAFLLDTGFPPRGDVDHNGCVDDADLLRVLYEFGRRGYRHEDLNWDGTVDDADLLIVLFNFGSEC